MHATQVIQLAYQGLLLIFNFISSSNLGEYVFGILVAIFQAATQIQEQTLSFTVKLCAVTLTLMFLGGWLGAQIMTFASNIFQHFPEWSLATQ